MEAEKRIRREIANSNERRRMQSINNGFQSLRSLLPHHEGEKLSKVGGSIQIILLGQGPAVIYSMMLDIYNCYKKQYKRLKATENLDIIS